MKFNLVVIAAAVSSFACGSSDGRASRSVSSALVAAPALDTGFPIRGGVSGDGAPVTISYSTPGPNRLVLLAVEANTISGLPIHVSGSKLAWTQLGAAVGSTKSPAFWTSWWVATAAAATSETVTISLPGGGWWNFVDAQVISLAGAAAVGATATAHDNGSATAFPSVTLTPQAAGSLVLAAGAGTWANRSLSANSVSLWMRPFANSFDSTDWLAELNAPTASGPVTLGTQGGNQTDTWSLFAVEVLSSGTPAVTVSVAPLTASLLINATQSFSATVTGTANTAVSWTVQEGAAGGSVTAAGVYTAPASAGVFHVIATSQADTTKSASATVTVTAPAPVSVAVSPKTATILTGATQSFSATVTGSANAVVNWSVQEGAAGGSITTAGLYTAPGSAGTFHVVATSQADATKSDLATVTVSAPSAGGAPPVLDAGFPVHTTGSGGSVIAIPYSTPGASRVVLLAIEANAISGLPVTVKGTQLTWTQIGGTAQSVKSNQWWTQWWFASAPATVSETVSITLPGGGWWNFVDAQVFSLSGASTAFGASAAAHDNGAVASEPSVSITAAATGSMLLAAGDGSWSSRSLDASSNALWLRPFINTFDPTSWVAQLKTPAVAGTAYTLGTVGGNQADTWALNAIEVRGSGGTTPPPPPVTAVAVTPKTAALTAGGSTQLSATVTGNANTSVTWSVQEGAAGGSVTQAGKYTAPASAGTFHVLATSQGDTTKSDFATVTVTLAAATVVAVSPKTASILAGGSAQFSAAVTGNANTAVTWSVQEGASGGGVTQTGTYTAPSVAGTFHVVATSQADTTKSDLATVAVSLPAPPPPPPPPGTAITYANDSLRSGWYSDQTTLTPALVGGGTFGQQFSTPVNGQIYAQPLVWNGTLFIATQANWIYGLDANTGAIRWSRNLGTPFNPAELACGDLTPAAGISGTPVIDSSAGTAYLVTKSYLTGTSGPSQHQFHAIDLGSGAERTGFPVTIQGTAQNSPGVTFPPRTELQRSGLLLMNGVVYAAFGGHCDAPPYQGWIAGVTTTGQLTPLWAAASSGAGIWDSGNGLMSDRAGSITFATGNGVGTGASPSAPTPGNAPPANLGESAVRVVVQADNTLKAVDFFTPFNAPTLDANDSDFGAGGIIGLPPAFFGTAAIPHLAVVAGKTGIVFLLNADSLGGCQQGAGAGDQVVAELGPYTGAWSHPAVWPGDGGWMFLDSASASMGFFQYGLTGTGTPTFSRVANTTDQFGFGSGAPIVTSNGTQTGSALVWVVWMADGSGAGAQLRAYDPVPVSGVPHLRFSAPVGAGNKFTPPGVWNGHIYVGARDGHVLGFGAPSVAALSGVPLSFPATPVGSSSTLTETLTASSAVTISALSSSSAAFVAGAPSIALPATLAAGQSLTVPIRFSPTQAGMAGSILTVTNSGTPLQVSLSGTGQAAGASLTVQPAQVSFGGVVVGTQTTQSAIFTNAGNAALTINGTTPPLAPFSAGGLPATGATVAPGQSFTVVLTFAPSAGGQFAGSLTVQSSGGDLNVPISGNATVPGVFQVSPLVVNFGSVPLGANPRMSFVVSNSGGGPIVVTRSKPPVLGTFVRATELFEGTSIAPGASVTETVEFLPGAAGTFTDTWSLNSDSSTAITTVTFNGTAVASGKSVIPDPAAGGWQVNGTASVLGSSIGSQLQLTTTQSFAAGSAFWPFAIPTSGLSVSFDTSIGGGTGADGLALVIADPSAGATPFSLGAVGSGLGFGGIPGFAVALSTSSASDNFVGIANTVSGNLNYLATSAALPSLRAPHHLDVSYAGGKLSVSLDGSPLLSQTLTLPPSALIGFSGGNGLLNDNHAVANVTIVSGP
jgi:hypothetical protein